MTTSWHAGRLTDSQAARVESWIGAPEPVADLSWHQTDTTVTHVRAGGQNLIVKAGGSVNRHIGREITAHRGFTASLVEAGRAARLVAADPESHVLVLMFLPGVLVEESPVELDPDIHEQAGRILQTFHGGGSRIDETFEEIATARTLATLLLPHRIAPAQVAAAQRVLRACRPGPATVVPTHGDWQPRNWLTDRGALRVIDFGRASTTAPPQRTCAGWRSSSGAPPRSWRPPFSPVTAPTRGTRHGGRCCCCGRRSAPRSGRTRSVTLRSNGRATGCSPTL